MIPASATDARAAEGRVERHVPGSVERHVAGSVEHHVPMRRCVLCRASLPQADLLRFVLDAGAYRFDERRRLGGRGTWVCRDCATTAATADNDKRLRSAFRGQALNMRELLRDALAAGPRRPSATTARQDGGMDVR